MVKKRHQPWCQRPGIEPSSSQRGSGGDKESCRGFGWFSSLSLKGIIVPYLQAINH